MIADLFVHFLGLDQLEKKGSKWHFRCDICGDSSKSASKKRAWIYLDKNGKEKYHCYNCGKSMLFMFYLKEYHSDVYKDYLKEVFKDDYRNSSKPEPEKPKEETSLEKLDLPLLIDLGKDHAAVRYILEERQMDEKWLKYLFYSDNYMKWINSILPDKCVKHPDSDERIVIPYYNKHRKVFCVQGRALDKYAMRYITIKFDEDSKKIWGLERINPVEDNYVLEGMFDASFFDHSIAAGGADIDFDMLCKLAPKEKYVFVYDTENRNKEMCQRVENTLQKGFRVVLLPEKIKKYGKDINNYICRGIKPEQIIALFKKYEVSGIDGIIKFNFWRKC